MKVLRSLVLSLVFLISVSSQATNFKKVMIVVLENTNYASALKQPFFNQLTQDGALFTSFVAETHPSQPNYIAMIAGDTMGVTSDKFIDLDGAQIGDLLEKAGKSWKVYAEDYPGNCFLASQGKYARKHVPFLSFKSVQSDPVKCAKIVNANELETDIAQNRVPDFSLFIPNLDNDGHDTNSAFADQYLASYFAPKLKNAAFMQDLLVVFTFDEAEGINPFNNQIYTVLLGPSVAPGSRVTAHTNHYDVLRTIEENLGLGTLGRKDVSAKPILGIWK